MMSNTDSSHSPKPPANGHAPKSDNQKSFWAFLKNPFQKRNDTSLRETLEDYLEEDPQIISDTDEHIPVSAHEKTLIANILKIHELTVEDVMIPRADIFAIDVSTPQQDLLKLLSRRQFSRIPVFKGTLDEALGCIHIKDVLSKLARDESFDVSDLVREAPIVSPSMRLLDLLWDMRQSRKHMCLVVDEFGGIDGLITIGDLVESVIGEIDDEHDEDRQPELLEKSAGIYLADARYALADFEEQFGNIFNEDEHDECDTLGGLVFLTAGRIPARGEVVTHDSGIIFEIMEADPRRIHRIRIKNIPAPINSSPEA